MLISRKKKEENIAEYVLYMWQLEDLIRSLNMDAEPLIDLLVDQQDLDLELKEEMRVWYRKLVQQMKDEGLVEKGHLSEVLEVLSELEMLHQTMLGILNHAPYIAEHEKVKDILEEARKKMDELQGGEVECGLLIMYGVLTLRLKKQTINKETEVASGNIASWLGLLAGHFIKMKSGDWNVGMS
ncbi:MAG: hypothetical protein ACJAY8_000764 [Sphingobacteriales bacterium]|jgi:hypothetical protein